MTRRHLQIALGLLWLLDGVLQALPDQTTGTAVASDLTGGHIGALVAAWSESARLPAQPGSRLSRWDWR